MIGWAPDVRGDGIALVRPLPWARPFAALRFEPSRWGPCVFWLEARDGAHLIIRRRGSAEVALWLPRELAPRPRGPFGLYLHADPHLLHRARAVAQFRRAIGLGPPLRTQRHRDAHRLAAMLCVHDLARQGHKLRAIADSVLASVPSDWRSSSERSDLRRLADAGETMVAGGYRTLLHPARSSFRHPI